MIRLSVLLKKGPLLHSSTLCSYLAVFGQSCRRSFKPVHCWVQGKDENSVFENVEILNSIQPFFALESDEEFYDSYVAGIVQIGFNKEPFGEDLAGVLFEGRL